METTDNKNSFEKTQSSNVPTRTALNTTFTDFPQLGGRELRPFEARRVERLHERAATIVDRAHGVGVDIAYLGIAPLFKEARLYRGINTDWVLAPADEHEQAVVPRPQRAALRKLHANGLNFPLLYAGHEVEQERTKQLLGATADGLTTLTRAAGAALVGPTPAPVAAVKLGDRLGQRSTQILSTIGRGAPIAGGILLAVVAAPFVLVGGAVAGMATLDPIIFGTIPALDGNVGEPAAYFELCSWDW